MKHKEVFHKVLMTFMVILTATVVVGLGAMSLVIKIAPDCEMVYMWATGGISMFITTFVLVDKVLQYSGKHIHLPHIKRPRSLRAWRERIARKRESDRQIDLVLQGIHFRNEMKMKYPVPARHFDLPLETQN